MCWPLLPPCTTRLGIPGTMRRSGRDMANKLSATSFVPRKSGVISCHEELQAPATFRVRHSCGTRAALVRHSCGNGLPSVCSLRRRGVERRGASVGSHRWVSDTRGSHRWVSDTRGSHRWVSDTRGSHRWVSDTRGSLRWVSDTRGSHRWVSDTRGSHRWVSDTRGSHRWVSDTRQQDLHNYSHKFPRMAGRRGDSAFSRNSFGLGRSSWRRRDISPWWKSIGL